VPGAWSQADVGGGGAALYGCDTGTAQDGFATFRYVRAGATGDGTRAQPFGTLQAAYASVGSSQKVTICVEEGTYHENVGAESDDMARGYRFVGAFEAGSGFARRHIAGGLSQVVAASAAAPVLRLGNHGDITVDGFDLSGGLRGLYVNGYAAGRKLAVRNNRIHHNGAMIASAADLPAGASENSLGGVVASGSDVIVEYNEIHDNQGAHNGAGLNLGEAASSEQNTLDAGGTLHVGNSQAVIRYNRIHHNVLRWDTPHGAGMTLNVNALVQRNVFWANESLKWAGTGGNGVGGGMIAQKPVATVTVVDNWFEGNRALTAGAGIFFDEATIGTAADNVVIRNDGASAVCVDGRAGGDASADRSFMTLAHNTIAWNTGAAAMVEDSTLRAYNNLMWHNAGAGDVVLQGGGALAEDARADHDVMRGGAPFGGLTLVAATDLEAAVPFVSTTLAATGQLSLGVVDLRPTAAVGSDALATFAPAFAWSGALAAPPATDAAGAARGATGLKYGAYQGP
jgi:hypothetical protein